MLGLACGDSGIPQTRSVAVDAQTKGAPLCRDASHLARGKHAPCRTVMRVLHAQQRGRRRMQLFRTVLRLDRCVRHAR